MRHEFTAVIERDGDWFIAYCPEIPGANGQGRTKEEARESLAEAIALILKDRREDGLRGLPDDAALGSPPPAELPLPACGEGVRGWGSLSGRARGFSVIFSALTSTPKMPIFPLAPKRAATDDTGDAERETVTLG